ncbi:2-oxoglutarate ferredoxin oxidoreductase subunit beta [bacterium 3DAC]|jgi:2-oxoglutarate ferredoxin oxidoreductase subunit beta|nr:2-oxoglutarate ferredoxin oxidoreductase subunit beta [Dictyoglomota bacterium]UZN23044.1 2-oxoglutarate ferredoxin oxidoreductase subunit beta [bacterium 3DAC]
MVKKPLPYTYTEEKWIRDRYLPHQWCPGCGIGTILKAVIDAMDDLGWEPEDVAFVSGIGCTGRSSGYVNAHTFHTIHGRAIPVATGIKLSHPELHVVTMLGDGDGIAIGGNHFIHAAKRNIGITAIIVDNSIYGMTGGQVSPTTPENMKSTTSIYGALEPPMDPISLALGAGATFVARAATWNPVHMRQIVKKALEHDGFAVVDIKSQCPTYFGRYNGISDPVELLNWYKEHTYIMKDPSDIREGKLPLGIFRDNKSKVELSKKYRQLFEHLRKEGENNG